MSSQIWFNPPINIGMTLGTGSKTQTRPHVIQMSVYTLVHETEATHPYWLWVAIGENGCRYHAQAAGRIPDDQLHTLEWEMALGERIPDDIYLLG